MEMPHAQLRESLNRTSSITISIYPLNYLSEIPVFDYMTHFSFLKLLVKLLVVVGFTVNKLAKGNV